MFAHVFLSAALAAVSPAGLMITEGLASNAADRFEPPKPQFLFRPDIHGDQVVFTSEGDLWLASIESRNAMRLTSDEGHEGPAYFSPDGSLLAFTAQYDGGTDVYVMSVRGGAPRRLTWDDSEATFHDWYPEGATVLGWDPAGTHVLFRSRRASAMRVRIWKVPVQGGSPELLPIPYGHFASIHADGATVVYVPISAEWQNWKRYQGGMADDLWLADTKAGTFRRLTKDPGIDTAPVWVGDTIYFVSERDGAPNLHALDPMSGAIAAATHYSDNGVRYPASDGRRIVFEHGHGIALFDPETGRVGELEFALRSDRIHARKRRVRALDHLTGVDLGLTEKPLLVCARGQILSAPLGYGEIRTLIAWPESRAQYPAWSPDGERFAFISDRSGEEQVWLQSVSSSRAHPIPIDHRGPLGPLVWSPDGKYLATSDREMRILLLELASGEVTVVDQAEWGDSYDIVLDSYRFSPDGNWLTYARPELNGNWTVHLFDVTRKADVRVTSPEMSSRAPAFDPEGRYLYFLADREFKPRFVQANRYFSYDEKMTKVSLVTLVAGEESPFFEKHDRRTWLDESQDEERDVDESTAARVLPKMKVDLEGLAQRVVEVPVPADNYVRVEPIGGKLLLETKMEHAEDPTLTAPRQLRTFDVKEQKLDVLVERMTRFDLSTDRRKLLVQVDESFMVFDAHAHKMPESADRVQTEAWILTIDPEAEWRQIFHETWRIARDFFYDPGMHGVDWEAVRSHYESLLPAIAYRDDLSFLQREMVSELNCGHAYIIGGDRSRAPRVPLGFLGADLEPIPGPTPAYRITKILSGDDFDLDARSALLAPGVGVQVGDYILAVGGQPVRTDTDIRELLVGTVGDVVALTVNTAPSLNDAREVLVRPMASERRARYYDWVSSRREYVQLNGGEGIGYLHIPDMGRKGLQEFAKHYYANRLQDGIVYDVRFNGGGTIAAMLLLQISSPRFSSSKPRHGTSWSLASWVFGGHSVAVCNERSGSNAEGFVDGFQRLDLGPVIGVRTWGGVVGSGGGYPMVDGGQVYIPNYAAWSSEGEWIIEGTGAEPDVVVEDDPAALMAGRDPQLDAAIEYLKRKFVDEPVVRPDLPAFPDKSESSSNTSKR